MIWLLLQTSNDPAADFARANKAMAAMRAFHVDIDSQRDSKKEGKYRMTATLRRDPSWRVKLDQREPSQMGLDKADRTFLFANGNLYAMDRVNQETFTKRAPGAPSDPQTFRAAMGKIDGSVDAMLNPYSVSEDLKQLSKSVKWKRTKEGKDFVYRASQGPTKFLFGFDSTTWRLRRYFVQTPDVKFDWKFTYRAAPQQFSSLLTVPSYFRKVTSFRDRPAISKSADAATDSRLRRAIRAHRNFLQGTVFADDRKILIDYPNLGEVSEKLGWTYSGGTLTVFRGGKFSGKVDRAEVTAKLSTVGIQPDLYTRELLGNRAPMRSIFGSESRAKTVGKMSVNGLAGTLVELSNSQGRVSAILRDKDGLVSSVETEIKDTRGNLIERSRRAYRYAPGKVDLRSAIR